MVIGKFSRTSDGWSGTIQTLTLHIKARFVPNDKRKNDKAPDFRIMCGHSELGAAWRRTAQATDAKDYLSVVLDDPCLSLPLSFALFETARDGEANLVWKRQQDLSTAVG